VAHEDFSVQQLELGPLDAEELLGDFRDLVEQGVAAQDRRGQALRLLHHRRQPAGEVPTRRLRRRGPGGALALHRGP
jgi:hypothetical protein